MNFEKLTQKSQEALRNAQTYAQNNGNQMIEPCHIALALVTDGEGLISSVISKCGGNKTAIVKELTAMISSLPKVRTQSSDTNQMYVSQDTDKILNDAENSAKKNGDEYVSVEHLMASIYKFDSKIARIMDINNVSERKFNAEIAAIKKNKKVTDDNPEETYEALKKYGSDLTERARNHKLDPVIGRDTEIRNVIRILSRKTKNNPPTPNLTTCKFRKKL